MSRTRPGLILAALLLLAGLPFAAAQQDESPAADNPAQLEPALLLDTAALMPAAVQEDAWSIAAQTGRRLIALPVRLSPVDHEVTLDKPAFSVRGGARFLCWQIVDDSQPGGGGFDRMPSAPGLFPSRFGPGGAMPPGFAAPPAMQPSAAAAEMQEDRLPSGVPRTARVVTLTADGRIRWELDRVLANYPAVQPNPASAFALKARPDLVRAMEPLRPGATRPAPSPQTGTGLDGPIAPAPRAAAPPFAPVPAEDRRAAEATYREQVQQFNTLREQLRNLPETFEEKAPTHLRAIYEIGVEVNELSLGGSAPLPWRIALADLELIGSIQGEATPRTGPLDPQAADRVAQLARIAADRQPMTHRLVAAAVMRSGLAGAAAPGNSVYRLFEALLAGGDEDARRTALMALGRVNPPTQATATLLLNASRSLPGELKVVALRGLLNGNFANPQESAAMIGLIQTMLDDPQGPDAGLLVRQVVEQVANRPDALAVLPGAVHFGRLSPAQRDRAADELIAHAADQPLAAAWLDRGWLGSFDATLPAHTLERIIDADAGPSSARSLARTLTHLFFQPPADQAPAPDRLKLAGPLPITSPQHHLINLLNSGDDRLRQLAWRALPAFTVDPPPSSDPAAPTLSPWPGGSGAPGSVEAGDLPGEAIGRIVRAGLGQAPTPNTLALFLARQRHARAAAGLMRVVIEGDDASSAQASTALLGSRRAIGAELLELDPADRAAFAARFHAHITGEAMPVVQLLRHPEPQLAQWLGERLAAGRVPQSSEWAQGLTEPTLLRLAGSSDAELAGGAVAALVLAAGGDRFAADEQIRRFTSLPDRSEAGIAAAWAAARKDIFTRRLRDAAGMYDLVLNLDPSTSQPMFAPGPGRPGGPVMRPGPGGVLIPTGPGYGQAYPEDPLSDLPTAATAQSHTLATVELIADGTTVSIRNAAVTICVPDEAFAIRLNNAGELKNFPVEALATIDLQSIAQPIDLLPQADGSWKGSGQMRDGSTVEVVLQPAAEIAR